MYFKFLKMLCGIWSVSGVQHCRPFTKLLTRDFFGLDGTIALVRIAFYHCN